MLALAEWARANSGTIESTVAGRSMLPTLPAGTRIVIDLRDRDYRPGAIVAVLSGNTVTAHRLIGRGRGRRARGYWIARGDANALPDPPVSVAAVLGSVRLADGGELAAEPRRSLLVRIAALIVTAALEVDVRFARALTRAASAGRARLQFAS